MGEMALTRDVGIFAVNSGRPRLAGKNIVVICTACGRADRGSGGRKGGWERRAGRAGKEDAATTLSTDL